MIEYIQIRNFQSHKETEMEFHPGVNVIVGESDCGKTAIMRAFYWLIFGRPAGDSMRRHGARYDTEVTVETAEHQISRIRGNSTNQYIIDDEVLKGFGQTVPQPIIEALNINEINFMRQMDPPFLFSKTAGEVAQYLNRLINLDIIDSSLSNIKRMYSQAERAASAHLKEAQRFENDLKKFDWIESADAELQKMERSEAKIQRLKVACSNLDTILSECNHFAAMSKKLAYVQNLVGCVADMESRQKKTWQAKQKYETLRTALYQVQSMQAGLRRLPKIKGAENAISALEKQLVKLDRLGHSTSTLQTVLQALDKNRLHLQTIIAEHKQTSLQLRQAMPRVCPLCDQKIVRRNK